MSVRLSCPSCNTSFVLEALPADRRATCPRCGDAFPVRGEVAEASIGGAPAPAASAPHSAFHAPRSRTRSFRRNAVVAASLLLVALAAGLAIYYTHAPEPPPQPRPESLGVNADAMPPVQLGGLGYLPAECNVIFAVQPGPAIAFARRTKQEPNEVLARLGVPPQVPGALAMLGLPPEQIDHIAGGAVIGNEGDDFRFALVLVLKQPLSNEEQFLLALKAKPVAKKEARWQIELGKLPVAPLVAKVSPTVWVAGVGLAERDFAALRNGGRGPGGSQWSDGVRAMVARLPPDAAAWVAADDDRDWSEKPLLKFAMQTPEGKKWLPPAPVLKEFRGGLAAVSLGEQPRLRLFARCADDAAGARLRRCFLARAAGAPGATAGGTGAGAQFDAPLDLAAAGPLLQGMLNDAKK